MTTKITNQTTLAELAFEFTKNGVALCLLAIRPDGERRCSLATEGGWIRGHGIGATEAEAIFNALQALRVEQANALAMDEGNER